MGKRKRAKIVAEIVYPPDVEVVFPASAVEPERASAQFDWKPAPVPTSRLKPTQGAR